MSSRKNREHIFWLEEERIKLKAYRKKLQHDIYFVENLDKKYITHISEKNIQVKKIKKTYRNEKTK